MSRIRVRILSIFMVVMVFLTMGVQVFADTGGSGTGGTGDGTGTQSVTNGVSWQKSGFVFYIVDKSKNIIAQPSARVTFDKYPNSSYEWYLETRFGDQNVTKIDGSMQALTTWWNKPPFNENSSGNGGYIKNWFLSKGSNGNPQVFNFIEEIWGATTAQSFIDNDDYYLIVEPFIWGGLHKGNKFIMNVIGTTLGWVSARKEIDEPFGKGLETRYTLGNLPNSMAFDIPVLGVPAPTTLKGKQSHFNLTYYGYGAIAVWSSEIKETPEPPTATTITENADAIKSNELNYIYKNFSGARSGSKDGFTISSIDMNDYRTHATAQNASIDDYSVTETKSGDLWSFKGNDVLFYRPATGLWKTSTATKSFGKNDEVYPQYTYNISRALWDDMINLCSYRPPKVSGDLTLYEIKHYGRNQLGLGFSDIGGVTEVSSGENVDATYGVTKSDSYSFKGSTTERWQEYEVTGTTTQGEGENATTVDVYSWVDKSATIESGDISYSVTHYLDKYKAPQLDIATNSKANTFAYTSNILGTRAINKAALILEAHTPIKVYPEVLMKMYYTDETKTHYDGVEELEVYTMGEQMRKAKPTVICSWQAGFTNGAYLTGKTNVISPMTGTNAFKWSETWAKDGNYQESYSVSPQGGGFEVGTKSNPYVRCTTISLDVVKKADCNLVRKDWGNSYNPQHLHDSYVTAIENSLDVGVKMKRFSNNTVQFGNTYDMSFDISDTTTSYLGTEQLVLNYENDEIKNRDEVIDFISSKCGVSKTEAETILDNSGLEEQLDDMFITSADTNTENASKNKWYSEDSITLCLTAHQTNIVLGKILFSDKNDYGSSTNQNLYDITTVGKSGVQVRFFFEMFFKTDTLSFEGYEIDLSDVKYLIDNSEIKGARFLISNATTHDWLK